MNFKDIPKKYRPIPFWSWNEKLDIAETKEQIRMMDEAGIGGFFMHARGGLQTPYMGEEWFENVEASVKEGKNRNMCPWAYDENGWPSGFGNGLVNGMGVEYQRKYLRMETELSHQETFICKCGEHYFYYEVNPFYVDTLDKKVVSKFIEVAYQPYYERFGNDIEGFFTDEPHIARIGIPWSFVLREEYRGRYGNDIYEHLEELFLEKGNYKKIRINFWKMITELFSEAYMKQIHDWCKERGMKLTGHLLLEENLYSQLFSNGACMPHYEYMDIPGMDWLGRNVRDNLTARQVSSVAEQLGKKSVLAENYALCGHNVSFAELKGIYEWQTVRGINLLCQHLEGYSMRGIRKRDYPPAMYVQQPWWKVYDKLMDALSRESMILAKGKKQVDVLLLHPETTAWSLYNAGDPILIRALHTRFLETIKLLERKHIVFHLGDEILLERHGRVEEGKLVLGEQKYSYVIDSCCEVLLPNTEKLLEVFVKEGGRKVRAEELADNPVVNLPEITYTKCNLDDVEVHFFVNSSAEEKRVSFKVAGQVLDIYSGEMKPFKGKHVFEPWGSLIVLEDTKSKSSMEDVACEAKESLEKNMLPEKKLRLTKRVMNCLTLDRCDYYFDGVMQEKNGYVLNICERANVLERKVQIHQDYHVQIHHLPEELYLICETPERFRIMINNKRLEKAAEGYYVDKSFQKFDIVDLVTLGENVISFDCDFLQSDIFYQNLKRAYQFEGEKNKLAYDMEIEPIYLVGDFGVRTEGTWTELDNNAVRYHGSFELDKAPTEIYPNHIEKQGYPFFGGEMVLEGELDIQGENSVLKLTRRGITAVKVEICDKEKWLLTDDEISLKDFGVTGKVTARFTLINNLRNLLGPHHLEEGECLRVNPGKFYKEPCVWNMNPESDWNEDYCFVEMSL